ncbi:PH domain-containing protein [Microbacterium lacticum]
MIGASAIAVLLLGDALIRAGIVEMLRLSPWVLLALWAVYVLLYASRITFDRNSATVQNYLRITRLPWSAVRDIGMRWQVVFTLEDGETVPAYGGPGAGRPGRAERRASRDSARRVPASLRELSELRDAWQGVDAAGEPAPQGAATGAGVARSWDVPAIAALVVIVIGAVVSALSVTG